MFHHVAKKSLGQNFLTNEKILEKICQAAQLTADDCILEIGPGKGALTRHLVAEGGQVYALEKDDHLVTYLRDFFAKEIDSEKLHLIPTDVLLYDPALLFEHHTSYKIVANIPYNITGAIIEKFLSTKYQPSLMVLMVQKEVAERIVALDRSNGKRDKESILSIAVKAYSTPHYISTVKAGNFSPAPKVDSAILLLTDISRRHFMNDQHEALFFRIMKTGFAHKRKTLAGNLKQYLEPEVVDEGFRAAGLRPAARAEELSLDDWISLSQFVYNTTYGTL